MASIRAMFNRTFSGGNLELFRFASYLMFPIGFMVYFGTGIEEDLERQYKLFAEQAERRRQRALESDFDWGKFLQTERGQKFLRMQKQLLLEERAREEERR